MKDDVRPMVFAMLAMAASTETFIASGDGFADQISTCVGGGSSCIGGGSSDIDLNPIAL